MEEKLNKIRLSKQVSLKSSFSRNEAEDLIKNGKVLVNGSKIIFPAHLVSPEDKITILGETTKNSPSKIEIIALNKPRGVIVTKSDNKKRATIYSILPKKFADYKYIGRLDMNTEGLILLTNSGRLSHELEDPQNGFEREYEVRVFGIVTEDKINRMKKGVSIDGMHYKAKFVSIFKQKTDESKNTWLKVILDTGKNREVRKLMEFFNLKVNRLIRVRYADVLLSGLPLGAYTELHRNKIAKIIKSVEEKCGREIGF